MGPEDLAVEIVRLRRPDAVETFARRAARFRTLAAAHPAGDFLRALACLADAQSRAAGQAGRDRFAPALDTIIGTMRRVALPEQTRSALAWLAASPAEARAALAEELRGAHRHAAASERSVPSTPPAAVVFVAAALQVCEAARAASAPAADAAPTPARCPLCGSAPVAGVVLGDHTHRYLACALCAAQWYVPRLTCVRCGTTDALTYFTIDALSGATKAEACGACRTYLKLLYLESAPQADPVADDVATMALDLLVAEEGYARAGVNALLLPPDVNSELFS